MLCRHSNLVSLSLGILSATPPTLARSVSVSSDQVRVFGGEFVATMTVCAKQRWPRRSVAHSSIHHVLSVRSGSQVIRINASRCIAPVKNEQTVRNWSDCQYVSDAWTDPFPLSTFCPEHGYSVTNSTVSASPQETPGIRLRNRLFPEPFIGILSRMRRVHNNLPWLGWGGLCPVRFWNRCCVSYTVVLLRLVRTVCAVRS